MENFLHIKCKTIGYIADIDSHNILCINSEDISNFAAFYTLCLYINTFLFNLIVDKHTTVFIYPSVKKVTGVSESLNFFYQLQKI